MKTKPRCKRLWETRSQTKPFLTGAENKAWLSQTLIRSCITSRPHRICTKSSRTSWRPRSKSLKMEKRHHQREGKPGSLSSALHKSEKVQGWPKKKPCRITQRKSFRDLMAASIQEQILLSTSSVNSTKTSMLKKWWKHLEMWWNRELCHLPR